MACDLRRALLAALVGEIALRDEAGLLDHTAHLAARPPGEVAASYRQCLATARRPGAAPAGVRPT